jgi:hypothetical protein
MVADWDMLEALMGGTRAMRAKGETYLPRWTLEHPDDHKARIAVATLFPAYQRTVSVMVGKPFSKALTLSDDVPPQIIQWADDIDNEGVNLHVFAAEMFAESFFGLAGILVEAPRQTAPAGAPVTKAEQQAAGVRPYFVRVLHSQILGWRVAKSNGRTVLTQLRLAEAASVPDGDYGEKLVERVRVLTPGAYEVWEKQKDSAGKESWLLLPNESGFTGLDVIPFVPLYGRRKAFMAGTPPLLDLAYLNVKHWQEQSDQDDSVMYARKRLIVRTGAGADSAPMVASASAVADLPIGGDIKIVQGSAENVSVGAGSLKALEEQMIQAGAELLVKKPGDRSATESANDAEGNKSDLQRLVENFEDSLDQALYLMALYAGLPQGGHVSLFKDFGAANLSEASGQLVLAMRGEGLISDETAIAELKRRGELAAEIDAADEAEKIASQPPPLGMVKV